MKILVLDSVFAKQLELIHLKCIGLVFAATPIDVGDVGDVGVVRVRFRGGETGEFWKGEYQIVPPELENESEETIKLYFAL